MTSAEFVDCSTLAPGAILDVETKNRHYQIECLGGRAIRISGHPDYCPTAVKAELQGSRDKGGTLEPGIGCGRYLQVLVQDWLPLITSRVVSIGVTPPDELAHKPVTTNINHIH